MFVSAITLLPLVWRGCEATAREKIYLLLLEPAVKNTFLTETTLRIFHSLPKISSNITASGGGAAKKQKTINLADCLESIQAEAHSSKARRDRKIAAGYAKGFEEGKESGFALGLIDTGRELAVSRPTSSVYLER